MSILISSLSKNLITHVLEASSYREVWDIHKELFIAKSQAHIMQVQL